MLDKEVKIIKGTKYYLLGVKDGEKYWLEEGSWDCDWYWGFGYIEVWNKRYNDIELHTHFDSLFLKNNISEKLFNYFDECVLNKNEMWQILELMKTFYTLSEYSELIYRGNSNISYNALKADLMNIEEYKKINNIIIPALMEDVYNLLK